MADLDPGRGVPRKHRSQVVGAARPAQEVALGVATADGAEPLQLALGLDAFGDHVRAATGRAGRCAGERRLLGPCVDPVDEGLVDLEEVDREPLQVASDE